MKVFLSHSTLDRAFAERLAEDLKAEMFEPWLCELSIDAATNWVSEINRGLRDADVVLLLWSPHAASSPATELEWTSALAREIADKRLRLGLVLLADYKLPELLRTRQYIDGRKDHDTAINEIIQWLKERRSAGRVGRTRAPVYLPDSRPEEFVGRRPYLEKLRSTLINEPGMCLLSGEPGSGKSTIALMFALEAQRDFDAVVFQTCGQRNLDTIIGELADKLKKEVGEEVVKASPSEKLQAIKTWLKEREALLILDDVWLEAGALTAGEFISILPGTPVSILYTSRRMGLPKVHADDVLHVDAFNPEEAEEVFKKYLGTATTERHREALLEFANRVERLPIAITVGTELLSNQFGPLSEAARGFALANLKNDIQNVPGLLQRAIETQSEPARRLLEAASVCAPDGFWLPLAIEIAGVNKTAGAEARDNLVHASLMRMLDQERQRFQLHSLIRDRGRTAAASLADLQTKHAQALERLFKDWETRWKECRECLQEIIPASEFLWSSDEPSRTSWLMYWGHSCAKRIGELDVALRILQAEESFWRLRDDRKANDQLQHIYGNQALTLRAWGRLDEAFALLKKQEEICLELGNKDSLQISYGNQAIILKAWGRLEEAMALHKKEEELCLELGNKDSLQISYGNQAIILQDWGRLDEAMALHKKKEELCLELGNKDSLQISYGNQAIIFQDWGRLDEAMALLNKKEEICLELGNKESLAYCYCNWGLLAREQGDQITEKQKLNAALEIFTELKVPRERDAVKKELEKTEAKATGHGGSSN
ncbi:MAG: hypothetical protein DMG65_00130 [Candidatus Angelobacter sp. Gp1-AA117]|nr:MAG: hypothetical protein DMG65_00130 [Candidatus Angelobacter sp. Gp1-AA117]